VTGSARSGLGRLAWWIAVPAGVAAGLALVLGLDRAAEPARAAQGIAATSQQAAINQRIAQQGIRRANRANARIDALRQPSTGPAGPRGPAGPAGPGAGRIAFSAAAGAPRQTVLELAGVTISVGCETGAAGETNLTIRGGAAEPTTLIGSSSDDGGDPSNPNPTQVNNFQAELPAGTDNPLGGPTAADGEFSRAVATVLFATPARTVSVTVAAIVDGVGDRCSFNGLAVPAG
jgi:hypothetical protein